MILPTPAKASESFSHDEPSWLEINLNRLDANVARIRTLLSHQGSRSRLCAVVKADAYSLGATVLGQRLARANVDMLAVYSLNQARELVEAGIHKPILVMMPVTDVGRGDILYRSLLASRLHLMVHSLDQFNRVADIGKRFGCAIPVHLFLDTGLAREGMGLPAFKQALAAIANHRNLRLAGVCSHFANSHSDPAFCDEQLDRLLQAIDQHSQADSPLHQIAHIANTYATLRDQRYHLSMARVGLALLGYGEMAVTNDSTDSADPAAPAAPADSTNEKPSQPAETHTHLQPIVRWVSRLVHVTQHQAGETVGYSRTHTLVRDSTLGIIPVGYGDGYPQALSNIASVRLLGQAGELLGAAPVIGKVNMDQTVIDLTDAPPAGQIHHVELLSADHDSPCSLDRLAAQANVNCYEMLTRLSARLPRRYLHAGHAGHAGHPAQTDQAEQDAPSEPARWRRTIQQVRTMALVG